MAKDWKDAKQVQEKHEELLVKPSVTRRKFLQKTAILGLAAAVPASLLTLGTAIGQEAAGEEGSSSKKDSPQKPKLASGTIVDVPGVKVGQVQNEEALTGCTVIVLEKGSACGVDVRGSAPGTRETDLLNPINSVQEVNAVVLTGGSAYGLDAASGVMRYMEERGQGYNVGVGVVPIIPAAVIFDLSIGSAKIRPDQQMGLGDYYGALDTIFVYRSSNDFKHISITNECLVKILMGEWDLYV